jgi:biotin transporter BioY
VLLAFLIGEALILGLGTLHLAVFLRMGFGKAIALGFVPFLYGDAVKTAAAWGLYAVLRQRRR